MSGKLASFVSVRNNNQQRQSTPPINSTRQQIAQNSKINSKRASHMSADQIPVNTNENYLAGSDYLRNPLQPMNPPPPRINTPTQPSYDSYPQQQQPYNTKDGDIFDASTIASDFDETISGQEAYVDDGNDEQHNDENQGEIGYTLHHNGPLDEADLSGISEEQAHNLADEQEFFDQQRRQRKPQFGLSQPPQMSFKQSQTAKPIRELEHDQHVQVSPTRRKGISGRFAATQGHAIIAPVALPPNGTKDAAASRKRGYSEDAGVSPAVAKMAQAAAQSAKEEIFHDAVAIDEELPYNDGRQPAYEDQDSEDAYSDDSVITQQQPMLQSRPPVYSQRSDPEPQQLNLGPIKPDYEDGVLRLMSYDDLRKESFEMVPKSPEPCSDHELSISNLPFDERVFYHVDELRTSNANNHDERRKALNDFFSGMTKSEWEDAGDWFLAKFGDVMQKMKEARKEKRETVSKLESEIEEREKQVRSSYNAFVEDMERMKKGAKTVIGGRMS